DHAGVANGVGGCVWTGAGGGGGDGGGVGARSDAPSERSHTMAAAVRICRRAARTVVAAASSTSTLSVPRCAMARPARANIGAAAAARSHGVNADSVKAHRLIATLDSANDHQEGDSSSCA